jgi:hypothetical protein
MRPGRAVLRSVEQFEVISVVPLLTQKKDYPAQWYPRAALAVSRLFVPNYHAIEIVCTGSIFQPTALGNNGRNRSKKRNISSYHVLLIQFTECVRLPSIDDTDYICPICMMDVC